MDDAEYERQTRLLAEEFGRHLEHLRTQVFRESYRAWGKRLHLSPSYAQKLSAGQVGLPKRRTVVEMADRLGADAAQLQIAAGYVPLGSTTSAASESFGLLLGQLADDAQRAAVLAYVDHVRDQGIRKT